MVAGGFDHLLKTASPTWPPAYRECIGSVICTLPGVRETRTYAVMEAVKNSTRLPVAGVSGSDDSSAPGNRWAGILALGREKDACAVG